MTIEDRNADAPQVMSRPADPRELLCALAWLVHQRGGRVEIPAADFAEALIAFDAVLECHGGQHLVTMHGTDECLGGRHVLVIAANLTRRDAVVEQEDDTGKPTVICLPGGGRVQ